MPLEVLGEVATCQSRVGDGVGKQFDGFRRYNVDRPGIGVMPATAHGRIAEECNVMASMRRIDRGCETCLFGDQARDREAPDPRNDIVKKLIGVAGRLRSLEHHVVDRFGSKPEIHADWASLSIDPELSVCRVNAIGSPRFRACRIADMQFSNDRVRSEAPVHAPTRDSYFPVSRP